MQGRVYNSSDYQQVCQGCHHWGKQFAQIHRDPQGIGLYKRCCLGLTQRGTVTAVLIYMYYVGMSGKGIVLISYPDVFSLEETSGKIGHVLQSDWSMKVTRCQLRDHLRANFLTFVFHTHTRKHFKKVCLVTPMKVVLA